MSAGPHHRPLPSSEAVKLEAIGRLLRQALRLAEGADAAGAGRGDAEGPAAPHASAPPATSAPSSAPAPEASPPRPAAGGEAPRPGPGPGGPAQVGFLLNLLQHEQARLEEAKKEVARKDAELGLKIQFAKKKEEELEAREGELKKLDAQIRVRETQVTRREEKLRDAGHVKGD